MRPVVVFLYVGERRERVNKDMPCFVETKVGEVVDAVKNRKVFCSVDVLYPRPSESSVDRRWFVGVKICGCFIGYEDASCRRAVACWRGGA